MMNTKIVIAIHKTYEVPEDKIYLPVFVGASGKDSFELAGGRELIRDDEGDNISSKNPYYCELTGLYYAWKNVDADAIGLVHYRRYFRGSSKYTTRNRWERVISQSEVDDRLSSSDILVPKKRNYYIETLYTHYSHTLDNMHLDVAREIITEMYPEYERSCVAAYTSTSGYMFNMMIMKREYLDSYLSWLFPILDELYNRTHEDMETRSSFDKRYIGRVSEILFNVWLDYANTSGVVLSDNLLHNPRVSELPVLYMEGVNWPRKIYSFLRAKFVGKRYDGSF